MADEGFKRKLVAILSADVKGYSRLMRDDEDSTIRTLTSYRSAISNLIEKFRGHVVDATGDNLMAEFSSVVDAVNCAVEIQRELTERNAELLDERVMEFRIGINLGDVVEEEGRIYGDGVNIASRMEGLAEAGGVCISGSVYDSVESRVGLEYEYLGEQEVKNIDKPVRAYKVLMKPKATTRTEGDVSPEHRISRNRKIAYVFSAVLLIAILAAAVWQFTLYKTQFQADDIDIRKEAFPISGRPSIAVLPLENMTGDPQQQYFCDGMADQLITGLSQGPYLYVTARSSSFAFRDKSMTAQQIANELGVRYLLEGSVQRDANRVRVNVQLIDGNNGNHIWAERYDSRYEDLFELQDKITMEVMASLNIKMTGYGSGGIKTARPNNLKAYEYYLKGLYYHLSRRPEDVLPARQAVEEAINLDPNFSAAYRVLGLIYMDEVIYGMSDSFEKTLEKAEQAAQKALKADPDYPPYSLWCVLSRWKMEFDEAIEYGEKAVKQSPHDSGRYFLYGEALLFGEHFKEAISTFETAIRLAAFRSPNFVLPLAWSFIGNKEYDKAIPLFYEILEKSQISWFHSFAYQGLVVAYELSGNHEKARWAAENVMRVDPKFSVAVDEKQWRQKEGAFKKSIYDAFRKSGLPEHPPLPLPDKPSIAVLPFANMSGDQEQEYFSDGISEEIITALSKTPKLFVIARTSSFKYKGKEINIRTVGRELGVHYVLEGSVRKAGDKVRITAQLIDATTEKHLWAERYDRNLKEIFTIQDEITLAIIKALQVELTKGEMADLTGRGTKNLDAYLKALQAQEQWQRSDKQGILKAKQLALEAIALDEQYGWPYAILSWSYMMEKWLQSSESPKESMRLAAEAIQKALTLDESDHRIHIVLSNLYTMQGKHDEAIASAQRALGLCPGSALAHAVLGTALRFACRFSEAVQFREQTIKLDPFPTALEFRNLAVAYSKLCRYEDAIAEYKKALQANPNAWAVYFGLVDSYTRVNRKEEARIAAKGLLRIRPDFSLDWLAETIVPMYAKECRSKINDDIDFLRKADVGLQ